MSIAAQNVVWATNGPDFTNQVVTFGGRDMTELAYHGYITFTGDGSSTSVTVNWIDGTQTPFFTQANPPTAVAPKCVMLGPLNTPSGTTTTMSFNVSALTTTGCTLTSSAALPAVVCTIPLIVFPYAT
jgi:hypothetical protein